MIFRRSLLVWLLIMAAESIHGTLRTIFLEPSLGGVRARQVAFFTGSAIIFGITLACIRWIGATLPRRLIGIGLLWVGLTAAFEAALGRLVMHLSWDRILADYDLSRGGLMAIGMLLMLLMPWLAARMRHVGAFAPEAPAPVA
ncbi:MAG: hypothetical protein ACJ75H_05550 [Thermoanaerobaculia bacterium]